MPKKGAATGSVGGVLERYDQTRLQEMACELRHVYCLSQYCTAFLIVATGPNPAAAPCPAARLNRGLGAFCRPMRYFGGGAK